MTTAEEARRRTLYAIKETYKDQLEMIGVIINRACEELKYEDTVTFESDKARSNVRLYLDDIDTENYLYRVKPCEYSEYVGSIAMPPALMQEDVIYFLKNKDPRSTKQSFACVKVNFWQTDKKIWLHFFWSEDGDSKKLYVSDPDRRVSRSEKTDNFANEIIPDINLADPDKVEIYVASISQVKMLESRLRDVGYELKDGQMKRIDGNKA